MKKKILIHSIFYLLIVFFIAGETIFIYRKELTKHLMPTVEQIGDIHIEMKNDTAYISSKITAENKSFLKIDIDTLRYSVKLFDKVYMQGAKEVGFRLKPYGKDTIDFAIKVPYAAILKDMAAQRKLGDSATYSINLFLQYSTALGKSETPISKSSKLKIPQPPDLEVIDIKYRKVHFKSMLADVKIKIKNHNDVALSIDEMKYSMVIEKRGSLKGQYPDTIKITSNGETFVNLPIEITMKNIGRTVWDVIRDKDTNYYSLTINATVQSADSAKKVFHIDLTKEGMMELKK